MKDDINAGIRKAEIFQLYKVAILNRLAILPVIGSLAATLLVVATFNDKLLELTNFVRVLISILLLLIPSSIFFYLYENNEAANTAHEALEKEINKKLVGKPKSKISLMSVYFPWIGLVIISAVIFSVIVLIWCAQ